MTRFFKCFEQYYQQDPRVSVQSVALNGVVVSHLDEGSNDIAFHQIGRHAILVSLSGSDFHQMRIDDCHREAPAVPHDIALVPAGITLQSAWCVHQRSLHTLVLEFDETLFETFAPEVQDAMPSGGVLMPANYAQRPALSWIALLFERELSGATRRGRLFSDAASRLLALEIASSAWSVPTSVAQPRGHRADRRVRRAIDYIEAEFQTDVALTDVARAAGMSISCLTPLFRQQTGLTPYSYVIERRLRHAEHLLRTTDMAIATVAVVAGFADQAHMTRTMRARRDSTPRAIRLDTQGAPAHFES